MTAPDPEASPPIHKQHLISKVLLRRFCDGSNHLRSFDLVHGSSVLRSPSQVGWHRDFVEYQSADLEHRWSQVESKLSLAIDQVENGTVLDNPDSIAALRSAIALHFMRRELVKTKFDELHARSRERVQGLADLHHLDPALVRRAGDEFNVERPELWAGVLLDLFERAESLANEGDLEVISSPDAAFVIGDSSVLSLSSGGGVGFLPFSVAATHVLPVGPHHLVALGPAAGTFEVGSEFVDQLNLFQLRQARRRVFFQPSERTEHWVAEARGQVLRDP